MAIEDAIFAEEALAALAAAPAVSARPSYSLADALFAPKLRPLTDEVRSLAFAALNSLLHEAAAALVERAGQADIDIETAVAAAEVQSIVRSPEMASVLVHRAEEHRISRRLMHVATKGAEDANATRHTNVLDRLGASEQIDLASRAIAYRDVTSLRVDDAGQPRLSVTELETSLAAKIIWATSAAIGTLEGEDSLPIWSSAGHQLCALHDAAGSPQHLAMQLAARIHEIETIDGSLLQALIHDGDALLLCAAVAIRAGISSRTAWMLLFGIDPGTAIALLLAVGLPREQVEDIGRTLASAVWLSVTAADVDDLVTASPARDNHQAQKLLAYWRLNPAFRDAHQGTD